MPVSLVRAESISEIRLEKDSLELSLAPLGSSHLRRKRAVSAPSSSTTSLPPIAMATEGSGRAGTPRRVSIVCGTNVLSQKYQNYRHLSMSEIANNEESKGMINGDARPPAPISDDVDFSMKTTEGHLPSHPNSALARRVSFADAPPLSSPLSSRFPHQHNQILLQQRRATIADGTRPGSRRAPLLDVELRSEDEEVETVDMAKRPNVISRQKQPAVNLNSRAGKNTHLAARGHTAVGLRPTGNRDPDENLPRGRDEFCKSAPPLLHPKPHIRDHEYNLRPTHKTFNFVYNDAQQCSEMVERPIIGGLPIGDEEEDDVEEIVDGLSDSFPVFSDEGDEVHDEGSFLAPITQRAVSTTGEESSQDRGLRILRWILDEQERPGHRERERRRGQTPPSWSPQKQQTKRPD